MLHAVAPDISHGEELIPDFRALAQRPLFPLALYLMAGIAVGAWWGPPPGWAVLALLAAVLLCAALYALRVNITAPLLLTAFVAGAALATAAIPSWAGDPWAPPGEPLARGTVADAGLTLSGKARYLVTGVEVDGRRLEGAVLVTTGDGSLSGGPGDAIAFRGQLERPMTSRFYGDFNYRGYLMRQGVRFTAFGYDLEITPTGGGAGLLGAPAAARAYAKGVLYRHLSPDSAALVDALLSGDRSGISSDIRDDFNVLGVAHLLAVSGLNISLTAGAAWLLCRKLRVPLPLSYGVAVAVLAAYALFAGLTPSVERAAVMWLVMLGARMAARQYDPLSSIAAAAVLLLALRPLDLFDAGFQLSFAATAAIFLWTVPLMGLAPGKRWVRWVLGAVGVTVCVQVMALPMMLWYFGGVSLISPFANLLLVPGSFVLQLAGTALVLLGFAPGAASLVGELLNWYAGGYLGAVRALSGSATMLRAAVPAPWLIALYALLVLLLSPAVFRLLPKVRWGAAAALAVTAALMLSPLSGALTWRDDTVAIGESNTAISVYWQRDGKRYVACGGDWDAAADYLRARGVGKLDGLYLLAAKPPKDGAALRSGIGVKRLYMPGRWLGDPDAAPLLEEALLQNMEPVAAEGGPFAFADRAGKAALLELPVGERAVAFVPYAAKAALPGLSDGLERADAVLLNLSAARVKGLGPVGCGVLALPGTVAAPGSTVYNVKQSGSLALAAGPDGLRLTPWAGRESDGLQGNFR